MRKTIIEEFVLNLFIDTLKPYLALQMSSSFMAPHTFEKAKSYIFLWFIIPTEQSDNVTHVKVIVKIRPVEDGFMFHSNECW